LLERGDLQARHGRWVVPDESKLHLPTRVRAVVGQRLSRLQTVSREILQEASVLGQSFTFDQLQRMIGRSEKELDAALDEAAKAGIIREAGADGYTFNSALIRQSVYEQLSVRQRGRLHMAAGAALEQEPSAGRSRRAAELSWHFLQGDDRKRALSYAIIAGDEAEARGTGAGCPRAGRWRTATVMTCTHGLGVAGGRQRCPNSASCGRLSGLVTSPG